MDFADVADLPQLEADRYCILYVRGIIGLNLLNRGINYFIDLV